MHDETDKNVFHRCKTSLFAEYINVKCKCKGQFVENSIFKGLAHLNLNAEFLECSIMCEMQQ